MLCLQLGALGARVYSFLHWAGNNKGRETIPGMRHYSTVDTTAPKFKSVDGIFDDWWHYDKPTPLLENAEGRPIYRPTSVHATLPKERGRWEMSDEYLKAVNSGPHEVEPGYEPFDPMRDPGYQSRYAAPRGDR